MASSDDESSSVSASEERPKVVYTKDYDLHARRLPTKARVVADVPMPPTAPLSDSVFWCDGRPNAAAIKEHLRQEGRLSLPQMHRLIELAYEVFCAEETVLTVPAPVTGAPGPTHEQRRATAQRR